MAGDVRTLPRHVISAFPNDLQVLALQTFPTLKSISIPSRDLLSCQQSTSALQHDGLSPAAHPVGPERTADSRQAAIDTDAAPIIEAGSINVL